MPGHDIVVIGGSAGALNALKQVFAKLPARFPGAIFVVLHLSRDVPNTLPSLLDRVGRMPVRQAVDSGPIERGTISVAPPDRHLLLRPGHMLLRRGPFENHMRPAIDPLFRSAAIAYRSRVIAVVLSGLLDDGSAGLAAVKSCGGISVTQHPDDADWPEMPRNAMRHDHVDHSVTVAEMPDLLSRLVREPPGPMPAIPRNLIQESRIAMEEGGGTDEQPTIGRPSRLSCPHCGGVLNGISEPKNQRFRCQIGHAFSMKGLVASQNEAIERALDSALRIHRERVTLFRCMQEKSEKRGLGLAAAHWRERVEESERAVASLLEALRTRGAAAGGTAE